MAGFNSPIVGSLGRLIREAIQSANFVAGSAGWRVAQNGSAEFNNVTVRGTFLVSGPNGSYLEGYVTTTTVNGVTQTIPVIDFNPATPVNPAWQNFAGSLFEYSDSGYEFLALTSPETMQPTATGGGSSVTLRSGKAGDPTTAIILDADSIAAGPDGTDMGRGWVAGVGDPTDSAAVGTTETPVLTTPSFTFRAGRAYEVRLAGRLAPNTASTVPFLALHKTNAAGQTLHTYGRLSTPTVQEFAMPNSEAIFTVGAVDVPASIALTLQASAGTVVQKGRRWLNVYDVGVGARHPAAAVLV